MDYKFRKCAPAPGAQPADPSQEDGVGGPQPAVVPLDEGASDGESEHTEGDFDDGLHSDDDPDDTIAPASLEEALAAYFGGFCYLSRCHF